MMFLAKDLHMIGGVGGVRERLDAGHLHGDTLHVRVARWRICYSTPSIRTAW
jgi:hypothetical protein